MAKKKKKKKNEPIKIEVEEKVEPKEEEKEEELPKDEDTQEEEKVEEEELSEEDRLQKELTECRLELQETKDEFLLKNADLDNFRKRMEKEKASHLEYANEGLLKEVLPIIDNLERAVAHSKEDPELGALRDGVELTLKHLMDTLKKFGLSSIEAEGKQFDPKLHEAVAHEESSEKESGEILQVYQNGYFLKERLIRPAMVVVAKEAESKKDEEDSESDSTDNDTENEGEE
ncbi:MAG: nucleotide exchange factor GrpE [Deltaproteobacteria bacterium]|nr:nucleotide exchange factor GrpE [Deltaproteobacteria bacterium]